MDITYRCAKCGSPDIVVKVWYSLETKGVITRDWDNETCWCNSCKEYTTFGWFDLAEIQARNTQQKGE